MTDISPETPILNVWMSFEEALKLSVAVQECVRRLNGYNRGTKAGRRTGLNIAVHLRQGSITVHETTV